MTGPPGGPPRTGRRVPAGLVLMVVALGVLLLVGCGSNGPIASQTGTRGALFLHRLDRARSLAIAGQAMPSPARMDAVRKALGLPAAIALPGRTVVLAKDPYLDGLSGKSPGDFRGASARIRTIRSSLAEAIATRAPDRAAVRSALDGAYRDIRRVRPGPFTRILDAVAGWFSSAVRSLVQFRGWRTLLEWAVVLGLAFVLVRLLARGRLVPDRTLAEGRAEKGRPPRQADWRRAAEEALARGDIESAVRAFYLAMRGALASRGVVSEDPALTAGECRSAVGSVRPGLYPVVAEAIGAFERVVYGRSPGGMGDVDALRRAESAARAA